MDLTRKLWFVSHLKAALKRDKVKAFVDEPALLDCEDAEEVIEKVNLHVAVLSERYAEPEFCLDELLTMMKSNREENKLVLPVLYGVDLDDLRGVSEGRGKYAPAFDHHRRNRYITQEKLNGWEVALHELSWITGFCRNEYR